MPVQLGRCEDLLQGLSSDSVDAVITDPPYGLGDKEPRSKDIEAYLAGEGTIDTGGDFLGTDWEIPSVPVWRECYRVLKEGGFLLSFAGTRTLDLISLGIEAAGFTPLGITPWAHASGYPKGSDLGKRLGPQWAGWSAQLKPSWEPILVFSKGPSKSPLPTYIYCKKPGESEVTLQGQIDNLHPTKKPVELMRGLIRLATSPGALVLDPYVGSGTTAEACLREGRRVLGFEKHEPFYRIASSRYDLVYSEVHGVSGVSAFELALRMGIEP